MKTTIQIPKNELQALLPLCSRDETRVAIRGIYVELKKEKQPILVATDGRRIGVLQSEGEWSGDPGNVLLPVTLLEKVVKWRLAKEDLNCVTFTIIGTTIRVHIKRDEMHTKLSYALRTEETKFPKWREVMPKKLEPFELKNPCICLNPEYVGAFAETIKRLDKRQTGIKMYPGKTEFDPIVIRIECCPQFYGLIMPMRQSGSSQCEAEVPEWIDMPPVVQVPVEKKETKQ